MARITGFPPPRAKTLNRFVALASGVVTTVGKFGLKTPVVFTKASGSANLTINSATGAVTATAALTEGATQSMVGTITADDDVVVPFTLNLTGAPLLAALSGTFTLSSTATAGTVAGAINGETSGSTLSILDSAGNRVEVSGGNVVAGSANGTDGVDYSFTVRETLAGASNSPRDTVLTLNVSDAPPVPVSIGIMGNSWAFNEAYWVDDFQLATTATTVYNVSDNGRDIDDLIAAVPTMAANNPDVVILMETINSYITMDAPTYLTKLQTCVADLRTALPGVIIGAETCPPSTAGSINARRATNNPLIRAAVGDWLDFVVPLGDFLADADASDTSLYDNAVAPGHPQAALGDFITSIVLAATNPLFEGATATSPSAFTISDIGGAALSHAYQKFSGAPITGMAVGTAATGVLTGSGTWQLGRGGTANTADKTVFNGDWPAINQTSSATYPPATAVNSTLTIGSTADTFTTTTGPLATDDYQRADGAVGSTPVGGLSYYGNGVVSSNKLMLAQTSGGYAVLQTSLGDVDFTIDQTMPGAGSGWPLIMFMADKTGSGGTSRSSDFGRYYYIHLAAGEVYLHHETFGDLSLGTFTAITSGTVTVRVVAKASDRSVNVYADGSLICTATIPNDGNWLPAGTFVGVTEQFQNSNNLWDNLSIIAA